MNHRLHLAGVIVNLMPSRGREAHYRRDELVAALGDDVVWDPPVPRREAVREAMGAGVPIHAYGTIVEPVTKVLDAHTDRLLNLKPFDAQVVLPRTEILSELR